MPILQAFNAGRIEHVGEQRNGRRAANRRILVNGIERADLAGLSGVEIAKRLKETRQADHRRERLRKAEDNLKRAALTDVRPAMSTAAKRGATVSGYAAVWNSDERIGRTREKLVRGCFADALKSGINIKALLEHDNSKVLGCTRDGSLKLWEDDRGLAFELALPATTLGDGVARDVRTKAICGGSFRGVFSDKQWHDWIIPFCSVHKVDLEEITLTSNPAYRSTSVRMK